MNETGKGFSVPLGDINFGAVAPVEEKLSFYNELNGSMVELVRSLPPSVHTGAMLSLMRYSRLSPGEPLDFFRRYPAPSWSVIFHVSSAGKQRLSAVEAGQALQAQAMAMFLHSLDDHLVDGELDPDHVLLLLRSQAWSLMLESMELLMRAARCCDDNISGRLDSYYSAVTAAGPVLDIKDYLDIFREQMATWTIAPYLAAMKCSDGSREFSDSLCGAYENFGRAWRLLDDINDASADMLLHQKSGIYHLLPSRWKELWEHCEAGSPQEELLSFISRNGTLQEALSIVSGELAEGALTLRGLGLKGLAAEYEILAAPLKAYS
jgi:hypothetical protein